MLKQIDKGLWVVDQQLRVFGVELGTRMTIIDIDGNGTLLVHSPIKLNPELIAQIRSLGKVHYIIAPNRWHHLFVGPFKAEFPEAKMYCAPGLETKRSDLTFDSVISNDQNFGWNPLLSHALVEGVPMLNEVVLFHPQSRTLIATDLATYICKTDSHLTNIFFKIIGTYGKFDWSWLEKKLLIKDTDAYGKSLSKIIEWDFDRIIIAHGSVVETGGKAKVERLIH